MWLVCFILCLSGLLCVVFVVLGECRLLFVWWGYGEFCMCCLVGLLVVVGCLMGVDLGIRIIFGVWVIVW